MPNHVTTRCIVTGPDPEIQRFRETCIRNPEGEDEICLDFNTIIPMPEVLQGTESGSNADLGLAALIGRDADRYLTYAWIKEKGITTTAELKAYAEKESPDAIKAGQASLAAHEATGSYNWYDWSITHWGTKWNSYSFRLDHTEPGFLQIHFDTAWSFPEPIFDALAEMFPTLRFECDCFDEGWGFAGHGVFNGDETFETCDATDAMYETVYGHRPERD